MKNYITQRLLSGIGDLTVFTCVPSIVVGCRQGHVAKERVSKKGKQRLR